MSACLPACVPHGAFSTRRTSHHHVDRLELEETCLRLLYRGGGGGTTSGSTFYTFDADSGGDFITGGSTAAAPAAGQAAKAMGKAVWRLLRW